MDAEDPTTLLMRVRQRFSQREIAAELGTSLRTVARWEHGETRCPMMAASALRELLRYPAQPPGGTPSFTFVDLFAGIGGIRLGFERAGGQCVFTSEWNEWACKTYRANFGEDSRIVGDITKILDPEKEVPDHDVLLGGFPCQPFSIAGVSKKNALGRKHGFADEAQGTLFFDAARIIDAKRPKAFLLENVKNLVSHDHGNTFRVIRGVLEHDLHYRLYPKVVDARHFVPQHRERILLVGFRDDTDFTWDDLRLDDPGPDVTTILHPEDGSQEPESHYTTGPLAKVDSRYTLSLRLWDYLQAYAAKHQAAGNGFGFGLVKPGEDRYTRTLSARYYKDGSEILIDRGRRKRPRRLTPRECARLMGFPESFKIVVSDTQAYKQFGNSVAVPLIEAVARIMVPRVLEMKEAETTGVVQERLPLVA